MLSSPVVGDRFCKTHVRTPYALQGAPSAIIAFKQDFSYGDLWPYVAVGLFEGPSFRLEGGMWLRDEPEKRTCASSL